MSQQVIQNIALFAEIYFACLSWLNMKLSKSRLGIVVHLGFTVLGVTAAIINITQRVA